jgi:hypothetical protein
MEDVVMEIEDISRAQPATLPNCMVIPSAIELCREPTESPPAGGTYVEGYLPLPTPQPLWPRVFPGL